MRKFITIALVIIAMLCTSCGDETTKPSEGPCVVFVRWSTFGHTAATGHVENIGTKTARDVHVRSKGSLDGEYRTSATSPRDIVAGASASFSGARAGEGFPMSAPEIIWIKWEE